MRTHRTAVRPYRGGRRRTRVYHDLSVPEPHADHPVGKPGDPDGPGHLIDLAFDPNEPRDRKGRWSEVAGRVVDEPSAGEFVLRGTDPYPGKAEHTSWVQQHAAQEAAQNWFDSGTYWNGIPEGSTFQVWSDYQNPGKYGDINYALRNPDPYSTPDKKLRESVAAMFAEAGYTTTQKMTVYRALRDDTGHDWADTLKPGTVFEDDGIVSTTTFGRLAEGWLGLAGKANGEAENTSKIEPDDVVLEIRVPKGSRIVGGTTDFIETMLPPGTKFKIISSHHTRSGNAVNPLVMDPVPEPIIYTHVVAEAILPTTAPKQAPSDAVVFRALKRAGRPIPADLAARMAK